MALIMVALMLTLLSALLPSCLTTVTCTTSTTIILPPHTLTPISLPVPPTSETPTTPSLLLTVRADGDGVLQLVSSLQGALDSWSLLLTPATNHSRAVCVSQHLATNSSLQLSLLLTSSKPLEVVLDLRDNPEHLILLNSEVEFPTDQYSAFIFDPGNKTEDSEGHYLVSVDNPGGKCLEVGLFQHSCPWRDDGRKTRILSRGLFPIQAKDFRGPIVIVVAPAESHEDCFLKENVGVVKTIEKVKNIKLIVKQINTNYKAPTVSLITALLVISLPTMFCLGLAWHTKQKKLVQDVGTEEKSAMIAVPSRGNLVDTTVDGKGQSILKRRSTQRVTELVNRILWDDHHRYLRSGAYLHLVPLLVVFYTVPSAQLVFLSQEANPEMCHFNYGCARPWWIFQAFNHVFSNLGYIWFGLCFICLVWTKSIYFKEEPKECSKRGLVQQYGLYYAIGLAMVAEGLLSAIFHICPSNLSLQFDTTMIYLIIILIMVKIYQFR